MRPLQQDPGAGVLDAVEQLSDRQLRPRGLVPALVHPDVAGVVVGVGVGQALRQFQQPGKFKQRMAGKVVRELEGRAVEVLPEVLRVAVHHLWRRDDRRSFDGLHAHGRLR